MKYSHILSAGFILFLSSACTSTKKMVSPVESSEQSLPVLPQSEIDIPIQIYAPPVLQKAESAINDEFTSEAWPNYVQSGCDFRYKFRFVRSGMTVSCVNNIIGVQFAGNYQVAGSRCICSMGKPVTPWISGSCGFGKEPMRKVNLNIKSQLQFLPAYHIHTSTRLAQMVAYDKCQVSLMATDVTAQIIDSIKSSLNSFCAALDSTIAGLSLGNLIQLARERSFRKTDLGKYGYFQLNPQALRIGELNYAKDSFSISAGVSCKPEISSDSSSSGVLPPLPPLKPGTNRNEVSIYLNMAYNYPFLSKILTDTLLNKVFEFKGKTIVVKKVDLAGIGNQQVELKVNFAGSNKVSVTLRGRPVLDTARQTLTIQDLSYSLESQDLAIKIAKTLFKNKIRKTLKGSSYLDIGALIRSNLSELNKQTSRKMNENISLVGNADQVKILGLLATKDKFLMQGWLHGQFTLIIRSVP
jgi:hypothetical protein